MTRLTAFDAHGRTLTQDTGVTRFGHELGLRRYAGVELSQCAYRPGERLPPHCHLNPSMTLVLRGRIDDDLASRKQVCMPRTLICHPGNHHHQVEVGALGSHGFHLEFDPAQMAQLAERVEWGQSQYVAGGERLSQLASRLFVEYQAGDAAGELVVEGMILQLLGLLNRQQATRQRRPRWLSLIVERLHEEFMRRQRFQDLAMDAGVPAAVLSREFARHYGCTPGEYLRRLRVDYVARELRHGHLSLAELALAAGFADQSHMQRVFRQQMGLSPGQYRRTSANR